MNQDRRRKLQKQLDRLYLLGKPEYFHHKIQKLEDELNGYEECDTGKEACEEESSTEVETEQRETSEKEEGGEEEKPLLDWDNPCYCGKGKTFSQIRKERNEKKRKEGTSVLNRYTKGQE